jgi:hypothetical protein
VSDNVEKHFETDIYIQTLECAIRRVQVIHDDLKLNGAHKLLGYANDVNLLGGSIRTVKKNIAVLLVGSMGTGLEVNADKSKHMGISRDQNAGRRHKLKTDNSSLQKLKEFRYLGTTLTNQNCIQEENKNRMKSGNASYHSVQDLLSSSLLSTNLKIILYSTIILPVVLYACV